MLIKALQKVKSKTLEAKVFRRPRRSVFSRM